MSRPYVCTAEPRYRQLLSLLCSGLELNVIMYRTDACAISTTNINALVTSQAPDYAIKTRVSFPGDPPVLSKSVCVKNIDRNNNNKFLIVFNIYLTFSCIFYYFMSLI